MLHFGAVHHEATVYVNDVEVASHRGGYTPFEADVTDALDGTGPQQVVVRVSAPLDKREIAHGKQRSIPRDDFDGVCFTPSSGIWQSVWMEARPATYLAALRLRPAAGLDAIEVEAEVAGTARATLVLRLRGTDTSVTADVENGQVKAVIPVAGPRLWSPEDPHLYHVDATLTSADGTDTVGGYTGLRRIEAIGENLYLNGARLFVRGVLDQGYWPRTGITAPDDAALRRDIELAAAAGYNLVRKHLKLEDPRFVHHADVLGMLVWAEAGRDRPLLRRLGGGVRGAGRAHGRAGRQLPRDRHLGPVQRGVGPGLGHPRRPGQAAGGGRGVRPAQVDRRGKPAVENSGWTHVKTDLLDWHYYDESAASWGRTVAALLNGDQDDFPVGLGPGFVVRKKLAGTPEQTLRGLPNLNSEYGTGFTSVERGWQLRWQTQELRRHDRVAYYVYTEMYDIEHESAGLLDFEQPAQGPGRRRPRRRERHDHARARRRPCGAGA